MAQWAASETQVPNGVCRSLGIAGWGLDSEELATVASETGRMDAEARAVHASTPYEDSGVSPAARLVREHLAQLRSERLGGTLLAELATQEPTVVAGEGDRLEAQSLGDAFAAAVGELTLGLLTDRDDDPRGRLLQGPRRRAW